MRIISISVCRQLLCLIFLFPQPSLLPSYQPSFLPSNEPTAVPSIEVCLARFSFFFMHFSAQILLHAATLNLQPSSFPSDWVSFEFFTIDCTFLLLVYSFDIYYVCLSNQPSDQPSLVASETPSLMPTSEPSLYPSDRPTLAPTGVPSELVRPAFLRHITFYITNNKLLILTDNDNSGSR